MPYNYIVARTIASNRRSRMLAWRFLGGGIFALGVAAFVRGTLDMLPNLQTYALIFGLAALLLIVSSTLFVSAGEPAVPPRRPEHGRRRASRNSCAADGRCCRGTPGSGSSSTHNGWAVRR